jgi:tetratricopeptide (TPR) repeat protein
LISLNLSHRGAAGVMSFNKAKVLKSAEKYVQQGKIAAAIDEYRKIVDADPNDLTMINTLGDLCVRAGRTEEAIMNFSRIAESYRENGFTLKAIAMYKKINKLEPSNYETSLKLADLYSKQGLIVDARQQYLIVADAYKRNGHTKRALEVLKKIADLDPENTSVRLKLAESYHIEGLNAEALDAYLSAGQELLRKGRHFEGLQTFQKALSISPDSKPALKSLIDAYVQQGDLQKALDMLSDSLERNPGDVDLIIILGRTYLNAKMLEEAEETFTRLLELDKSRYDYLLEVGRRFLERGQFDKTVLVVDQCIDLLIARRQEEKAILLLKGILEYDANQMDALKRLSDIYMRVREDYNLVATLNTIVEVALRKGLKNDAIAALNQLVDIEPDETSHRQRLVSLGGTPPAQPMKYSVPPAFESLTQSLPSTSNTNAGFVTRPLSPTQADAQAAEKQLREAEMFASRGYADHAAELLEELIAQHPEYIEARLKLKQLYIDGGLEDKAASQCLELAQLYEEQGDSALASDLLSEAFELNPSLENMPAQVVQPNNSYYPPASPNSNSGFSEGENVVEIDLSSSLTEMSLEALGYQPDSHNQSPDNTEANNRIAQSQGRPGPPPPPQPPTTFEALFNTSDQANSIPPLPLSVKGATPSTGEGVGGFELNFREDTGSGSRKALDKMLKDELEGVDFYIAQGYMEIARDTLENLNRQYPHHPSIMQRLAQFDQEPSSNYGFADAEQETAEGNDYYTEQPEDLSLGGYVEDTVPENAENIGQMPNFFDGSTSFESARPEQEQEQPAAEPAPRPQSSSSFFDSLVTDIEHTLDEMPTSEMLPMARQQDMPTPAPEGENIGLEAGLLSIFEEFKSGLESTEEPDFETHYNLGLAYKDMELYDDAIEEFQIACKSTSPAEGDEHYFNCCNMLGFCFLRNNMARPAAVWYKRGLDSPGRSEDEYQAMRFDLGTAFERLGEIDKALELFQEVYAIDINYRNVSGKIRELQERVNKS